MGLAMKQNCYLCPLHLSFHTYSYGNC